MEEDGTLLVLKDTGLKTSVQYSYGICLFSGWGIFGFPPKKAGHLPVAR
jgi:hypothetical protein